MLHEDKKEWRSGIIMGDYMPVTEDGRVKRRSTLNEAINGSNLPPRSNGANEANEPSLSTPDAGLRPGKYLARSIWLAILLIITIVIFNNSNKEPNASSNIKNSSALPLANIQNEVQHNVKKEDEVKLDTNENSGKNSENETKENNEIIQEHQEPVDKSSDDVSNKEQSDAVQMTRSVDVSVPYALPQGTQIQAWTLENGAQGRQLSVASSTQQNGILHVDLAEEIPASTQVKVTWFLPQTYVNQQPVRYVPAPQIYVAPQPQTVYFGHYGRRR